LTPNISCVKLKHGWNYAATEKEERTVSVKKSVAEFFCLESGTAGVSRTVVAGALAVGVIAATMGVALAGDHIDGHCNYNDHDDTFINPTTHTNTHGNCSYQTEYHCNCPRD